MAGSEAPFVQRICSTREALRAIRLCNATNSPDKAYLVLGLVDDFEYGIVPDYLTFPSTILVRAAENIVEVEKSLTVSSICPNPSRQNGLPS